MTRTLLSELLLVAVLAWLIYASRNRLPYLRQLNDELRQRIPVFSAETTSGKEAEFIRERLPTRVPLAVLALAALLFVGAAVWRWLS